MYLLKFAFLAFVCLTLCACYAPVDFTAKTGANANSDNSKVENLPPFATKEPEKYSAKIVFASSFDQTAQNFVEQTYTIARDGANRRLDFESGEQQFSGLQIADGKRLILLPKQKVYAEISAANEKVLSNQPDEFSLEHLLHAKPAGATFQRIGEEEFGGRQTVKYRLDFGGVKQAENARTQTFIWADESLGLPVKTEIIAVENNQPSGARNIIELREIKLEIDEKSFEIPKDFRKVSFSEIQQILRK